MCVLRRGTPRLYYGLIPLKNAQPPALGRHPVLDTGTWLGTQMTQIGQMNTDKNGFTASV